MGTMGGLTLCTVACNYRKITSLDSNFHIYRYGIPIVVHYVHVRTLHAAVQAISYTVRRQSV